MDSEKLRQIANIGYKRLDEAFEEAPINEQLCEDIELLFIKVMMGFRDLREVLIWVYGECYLMSCAASEGLMAREAKETMKIYGFEEESMKSFYVTMTCIFKHKMGPLALYTKDYLAAMMRAHGMKQEAADVEAVELIPADYFLTKSLKKNRAYQ